MAGRTVQRHGGSGAAGVVKGLGLQASGGPWTSTDFLTHVRSTVSNDARTVTTGAWEAATLKGMDAANLFTNPFLGTLFG